MKDWAGGDLVPGRGAVQSGVQHICACQAVDMKCKNRRDVGG